MAAPHRPPTFPRFLSNLKVAADSSGHPSVSGPPERRPVISPSFTVQPPPPPQTQQQSRDDCSRRPGEQTGRAVNQKRLQTVKTGRCSSPVASSTTTDAGGQQRGQEEAQCRRRPGPLLPPSALGWNCTVNYESIPTERRGRAQTSVKLQPA